MPRLTLELNQPAVSAVEDLMLEYGESTPEAVVSRALGLLQILRRYVDDNGVLTVLDPQSKSDELVDLIFEHAQRPDSGSRSNIERAA